MTATGHLGQYVLYSYKNGSTYNLGFCKMGLGFATSTNHTDVLNLGGVIANSSRPHGVVVVRGKAYIKAFPTGGSDKLGLFTWEIKPDGTQQVGYWGLLGPTIPARLASAGQSVAYGSWDGSVIQEINASVTTITLYQTGTLAGLTPPFEAWIDTEKVNVTAIATGTPTLYDTLTVTRGYGGTTAAAHARNSLIWAPLSWATADHPVGCSLGWKYSYCWKNKNGQYSNRAKLETNITAIPSITPPISGLVPKITVTCPSDTTEYPKILILRSTDGGGTFFPLTEIDNPGTPTTNFEDKYYPTGSVAATQGITYDGPIRSTVVGVTFNTPVPDTALSGQYSGPGLLTNSPLPPVAAPKIIGADFPEKSTPLRYWKNRIWVAINNILFFTSAEELPYGIPEESCDTSETGGFFRFQENITQIFPTNDALLIFTRGGRILKMTGTTKDTFVPEHYRQNQPYLAEHPTAITSVGDKVFYVSGDYNVVMMDENSSRIISHPLGTHVRDAVSAGKKVFLDHYEGSGREWLVLGLLAPPDSANKSGQIFIYDLYKSHKLTRNYADNIERETMDLPEKTFDFWNSPWDTEATTILVCPYNTETSNTKKAIFQSPNYYIDTFTDPINYVTSPYQFVAITGVMENPAGYHVSTHAIGGLQPNVWGVRLERLEYAGDRDPSISIYRDSLWIEPTPLKQDHLQYLRKSGGYRVIQATLDGIGKYFAVKIEQNPNRPVNLQKLTVTFQPGAGV
jgi:hypothetical protein